MVLGIKLKLKARYNSFMSWYLVKEEWRDRYYKFPNKKKLGFISGIIALVVFIIAMSIYSVLIAVDGVYDTDYHLKFLAIVFPICLWLIFFFGIYWMYVSVSHLFIIDSFKIKDVLNIKFDCSKCQELVDGQIIRFNLAEKQIRVLECFTCGDLSKEELDLGRE